MGMVQPDGITAVSYSIIQVPHDDEGIRKYIEFYKTFRLLSLQIAPEAFGSTYAREIAFTPDVWYGRLSNPKSATFIAIKDSGEILSMSAVIGPLSFSPGEAPHSSTSGDPRAALAVDVDQDESKALHYRVNAIFTLPEARRQGISKAVITKGIDYVTSTVPASRPGGFVISLVVDADNTAAKKLYESCGFKETRSYEIPSDKPGIPRPLLELEYHNSSTIKTC